MSTKTYPSPTEKALAFRKRHGPIEQMTTTQRRRLRKLLRTDNDSQRVVSSRSHSPKLLGVEGADLPKDLQRPASQ